MGSSNPEREKGGGGGGTSSPYEASLLSLYVLSVRGEQVIVTIVNPPPSPFVETIQVEVEEPKEKTTGKIGIDT